jgi:hypothetical protein
MGVIHQYAPQKDYNDFHDGDTDEEIEMEAPSAVVASALGPEVIIVQDEEEEEDPEEVVLEEEGEGHVQDDDQGDHQDLSAAMFRLSYDV